MIGELDLAAAPPSVDPSPAAGPGLLAWALGALVVGTVIAVDPGGLVPTGPLRWTVITVTTGIAIGALVRHPVIVPRAMTTLWVALVGVLLLATINAVDPLSAWIGTPDRRLGFLTWITFPALFLAGYACIDRVSTRVVLRATALAGIGLGAWTTAELVGHPPLGLRFADARAGGPFGQPAYLGAACLLVGPLAIATACDRSESLRGRGAGALAALGAGVGLAASQTRAAWVGAAVATAVCAIALRHRLPPRDRRARVIVAAVAAGAVVVVLAVTTPLGARAASTFDLHHGTSASRLDEWRTATRTIADHPLLGVGPEGYRVVFPQEVDAAYIRKYGVAVFPDRAHNGLLDVTLAGGVAAGLLYAAILVLALRHAWRGVHARDPISIALGAAVIAYIVQQQFLFPLAELDPVFWVLTGMLVARTAAGVRCTSVRTRGLVVPIALVTAAALFFGGREVLADRALKRAATTADTQQALRDADQATRLRPDSIRAWYVAARVAQRGETITAVDAAIDRAQQGLDRSPRDPALRVLYGQLLVERAARSGLPDDIALARHELERLVAGAPQDPRLRNDLVTAQSLHAIGKP